MSGEETAFARMYCQTKFDVKPATIAGHYSCKGSTGYNNKTGQMGKVDIEVDFSAGS